MTRIKNILLDRDGTVITDKHYLANPAEVELLTGAAKGLGDMTAAKLRLFIVTNQSGIGRGYFTEEAYHACHAAMVSRLRVAGVALSGSAFCPHGPDDACLCRKPRLGMWQALSTAHGLVGASCAMVGDKMDDILFGRAASFPATVLVLTGKGADEAKRMNLPLPAADELYRVLPEALLPGGEMLPHAVAHDLSGVAAWLLSLT